VLTESITGVLLTPEPYRHQPPPQQRPGQNGHSAYEIRCTPRVLCQRESRSNVRGEIADLTHRLSQ